MYINPNFDGKLVQSVCIGVGGGGDSTNVLFFGHVRVPVNQIHLMQKKRKQTSLFSLLSLHVSSLFVYFVICKKLHTDIMAIQII